MWNNKYTHIYQSSWRINWFTVPHNRWVSATDKILFILQRSVCHVAQIGYLLKQLRKKLGVSVRMQLVYPLMNTTQQNSCPIQTTWRGDLTVGRESYLQEFCDTLGEVLVALDVQLQLVESGRQCRWSSTLVTAERQSNKDNRFHHSIENRLFIKG